MAKAKTATNNGKQVRKKGGSKLRFYTFLVGSMFAAPFMFPTVVLLGVGLIPTFVAFFVDKERDHASATAVSAMNCAGLAPFVIDLWIKGQTMGNVIQILSDSSTWLIILGASAVGQTIVSVVPHAMATVTFAHAELRIKTLKNNLDLLQKSWGPDVGSTKPLDKIAGID